MLNKEIIMRELKDIYNNILEDINKNQILGIFAYGDVNSGFAENVYDIKAEIIYIPTFEELCISKSQTRTMMGKTSTRSYVIYIRDIRDTYIRAYNTNLTSEILYTDYFILNDFYKDVFNKLFKEKRELILHQDKNKKIHVAAMRGLENLYNAKLNKDHISLFRAYQYEYFCTHLEKGDNFLECIQPDLASFKYMNEVKHQKLDDIEFKKDIDELEKKLQDILNKHEIEVSLIDDYCESINALKYGVMEIVKKSLTPITDIIDFQEKLTKTENEALKYILSEIKNEGNISIVTLTELSGISRPVFSNLFLKLKQYRMAEIDNQGVKGTYIKILNSDLYKIN